MKPLFIICLMFATMASAAPPTPEYQPVDVRPLPHRISVRMGQTVLFTFDQRGDLLVNPRVGRSSGTQPTIRLELRRDRENSILLILSSYPRTLRYRSAAHFRGKSGFVITATYPVYSDVLDAEGFGEDVVEFGLWDIRLSNIPKPGA